MSSPRLLSSLVPALAGVAFLVAGCGGGSPNAVADLAGSTTGAGTTTSSSSSGSGAGGGGTSSGTSGGGRLSMKMANGAKYAACMRSHGVPNFPDPDANGSINFGASSGVNPASPKFQAADTACRKELPNGGQPTPAQQAKAQKQALAFSRCMRSHGVPNFPDPQISGGKISITIGRGSLFDPNSATFKAAQQACAGELPGAKGSPGAADSAGK
jgi:hypothetical protein